VLPGSHEPIVTPDEWERVAALREAKRRTHKRGRAASGKHLFRKGFLRCGVCGDSLMPVTKATRTPGRLYERYACYGRHRNKASCTMQTVQRAEVDEAVFAYFAQVGLDVEATREQVATAAGRKVAEAQALLAAAEQEAQKAAARLAKVKRDYTHGDLSAAEWRELRADLEPEAEAADAEAERLRVQVAEAESGAAMTDAEAEVLEKLASIRAAVAGEVKDSEGVAAVRATLMRLFEGFVLHPGEPEHAHVELIGRRWLEPLIAPQAVEGYDEGLRPVIARQPLETAGGGRGGNYAEGFTT
jgi:hypothetical protein